MTIEFAVQAQPLGTADAVAAAEPVVGQRPFIMINSDNYYPLPGPFRAARGHGAGRGRSSTRKPWWRKATLQPTNYEVLGGRADYRGRRLPALEANHREARSWPRWPGCRGRWA